MSSSFSLFKTMEFIDSHLKSVCSSIGLSTDIAIQIRPIQIELMNKILLNDSPPPREETKKRERGKPHVCFLGNSLNNPWEWSWASLREESSFGKLSEMLQVLERNEGGVLRWNFHQTFQTLDLWMSEAGVKLPPEQYPHTILLIYFLSYK